MLDESRFYDHIQRDFPLHERPYRELGAALGCSEHALLNLLARDLGAGRISRVGAVFAPNVIGASTLAALAVPPERLDTVARQVNAHPAVSHNYGRDGHDYNLWFVAGARDALALNEVLAQIALDTGLETLNLPLEREFHIDLGFALSDAASRPPRRVRTPVPRPTLDEADWRLIAALEDGLPLTPRPFEVLAQQCRLPSARVLDRLAQWQRSGVIRRLGAVLHHRRFGFVRNAMCVWDLPDAHVDAFGKRIAQLPPVNLCYRRTRRAPHWLYNLFAMVHAHDHDEIAEAVTQFEALGHAPGAILVSHTCYQQRGTRYA